MVSWRSTTSAKIRPLVWIDEWHLRHDLLGALAAADVELRLTPRLVELWHRIVATTLDYSGTRLKNAQHWREPPAR